MPGRRTNRRRVLAALGGTAALAAAWRFWPREGVFNPCRTPLPAQVARHPIVETAWSDIDPRRVWDCHTHLIGVGDSANGVWINPRMESLRHPVQYAQRLFFLNAGCADAHPGRVDEAYVERLVESAKALAPGAKLLLLAFDHTYDEHGRRVLDHSAFHTPNAYAASVAARHPNLFEWAASVHPYRDDCVEALERAVRRGARAIKWLPPAMGIDPASAKCDRFYVAAARLDIPIISHAGEERAVHGAASAAFGNPLRLRRPLDHGVRVVVAHCASIGTDVDIDAGPNGGERPSFELFMRLMDEPRYFGRLYGDVSALTQANRAGPVLHRILQRQDWHERLLNGSDYPLPGIVPLISVEKLVGQGFLNAAAGAILKTIRGFNPLLFDFVLKRELRSGTHRFSPSVFHTRDFFTARLAATREGPNGA